MNLSLLDTVIDELDSLRGRDDCPLSDLKAIKSHLLQLVESFNKEITTKQLIRRTGKATVEEA